MNTILEIQSPMAYSTRPTIYLIVLKLHNFSSTQTGSTGSQARHSHCSWATKINIIVCSSYRAFSINIIFHPTPPNLVSNKYPSRCNLLYWTTTRHIILSHTEQPPKSIIGSHRKFVPDSRPNIRLEMGNEPNHAARLTTSGASDLAMYKDGVTKRKRACCVVCTVLQAHTWWIGAPR